MSTPIVYLDTETDGVHPDRRIWEIALIRREHGHEVEMAIFVDIDLSTADPFGLKIGHFYDRHPQGRLASGQDADLTLLTARADAALTVAQYTHGAHVIGLNPSFDTELLGALLRESGLVPAWRYHPIDVKSMAVPWLQTQGLLTDVEEPLDLTSDELAEMCGVQPPTQEERHTALGDTRWVKRWHQRLMGT